MQTPAAGGDATGVEGGFGTFATLRREAGKGKVPADGGHGSPRSHNLRRRVAGRSAVLHPAATSSGRGPGAGVTAGMRSRAHAAPTSSAWKHQLSHVSAANT